MGIYKQGLNRKQQLMFPPSLDELVEEDNVVRAIEAYSDTLDLSIIMKMIVISALITKNLKK